MLRVLVGEEADFEDVRQAAAENGTIPWIVPKTAQPGDNVLFFFPHTKSFLGYGTISSQPESTFFGQKAAYTAVVGNIALFDSPIPLAAVANRFPEWAWTRYPRSLTTPPPAVAGEILDFLQTWKNQEDSALPEEISSGSTYTEGSVQRILVNRYERDPSARKDCIRHYGATCFICHFDFAAEYGGDMAGFIHVHHLKLLSSIGADYEVDPIQDLRPVCPNCHAALHRKDPPYNLEEVQQLLEDAKRLRKSRR